MRLITNIAIVMVLAALVFMVCVLDDDVRTLKTRTYYNGGNLYVVAQRLRAIESGLKVGSNPHDLLMASATLEVKKETVDLFGNKYKWDSYSTGVFVSHNALLTTKHSIEDQLDVTITTVTGKTFTVKEIIEDVDDDLALIIVNKPYGPYLELDRRPSLGEDLICIGNPVETQLIMTWAKVASEIWKKDNTFIYDGFCFPGCSGGPVIRNGKVVGISKMKPRGPDSLGFATPVDRLDPEILDRIK